MRAFCKNFLGEFPQILCSPSYQQGEDSTSIYEQTKAYGRGKADNGKQIFVVPKEQGTEEEADTLLKRVQAYIRNHYTERLTLADIAEKVHVSASYLSRFYKQKAGENLFDTINSLRVEKAKELLIRGDKKIYEIAALTGLKILHIFQKYLKNMQAVLRRIWTVRRKKFMKKARWVLIWMLAFFLLSGCGKKEQGQNRDYADPWMGFHGTGTCQNAADL